MSPISYNWYLYSRSGGLLAAPPPGMMIPNPSPPSLKNHLFSRSLKKRLRAIPASLFHGFVSILRSFLKSFGGCFSHKANKMKKCVWTAPACTDRMSDLPENYIFLRFCLSFSGAFPRERFLCTFWAPRPPKPRKVVQKG